MREIKFRAWDEEKVKFIYFDLNDRYIMVGDPYYDQTKWFSMVKQQFTGLKDKNGKEIYEGDIIEIYTYISEEGDKIDREVYEVKDFSDEGYPAFDLVGWDGDTNGLSHLAQCGGDWEFEVIGNINENSNLLNN